MFVHLYFSHCLWGNFSFEEHDPGSSQEQVPKEISVGMFVVQKIILIEHMSQIPTKIVFWSCNVLLIVSEQISEVVSKTPSDFVHKFCFFFRCVLGCLSELNKYIS